MAVLALDDEQVIYRGPFGIGTIGVTVFQDEQIMIVPWWRVRQIDVDSVEELEALSSGIVVNQDAEDNPEPQAVLENPDTYNL